MSDTDTQVQGPVSPFSATQPRNVPLRPLNKGIILDAPPQFLPPGAMLEVLNFIVNTDGLRRRPRLQTAFGGAAVGYQPVIDLITAWGVAGSQRAIVLDSKFIYQATNTGLAGIYSTYAVGTITVSGAPTTTVNGAGGTLWNTAASDIKVGDVIILDADNSSGNREEHVIASIGSDILLSTETSIVNNHPGGTDYVIRRAFRPLEPYLTDITVVGPNEASNDNIIIFTDFRRTLWGYNVSTGVLAQYTTGTLLPQSATCTYFAQRLFIGHTREGANEFRQRIRWTSPLNRTIFDDSAEGTGFIDLAFTQGAVRKLLGLGSLLVAYFEDAIFVGRTTNIPSLPVQFERVESGGIGLAGVKAVASWLGTHFFVGQDDIYALTNRGIERIGTPVVRKTVREADRLIRVYAVADPVNDRIVFGFPKSGNDLTDIWSFDYKARAWSHDAITTTMLSSEGLVPQVQWDNLDTFISPPNWDFGMASFGSWDGIDQNDPGIKNLFYAQNGILYSLSTIDGTDAVGGVIQGTFETPDMDFGNPDISKFYNRISIKLRETTTTAIPFTVTGSVNRGGTFKSLGTLTIGAGRDEAYVTFRLTGSIARFRFVTQVNVPPYVITEIVVRARHRGLETA